MDQLAAVVEGLGDVDVAAADGNTEYRRAGRAFASRGPDGAAELRLPPDVAEAASRTPSTSISPRGPDWIRFAPAEWDDHARDRLDAWFRLAWRAAAK